jgi:ketosteroid isomerase-like protein
VTSALGAISEGNSRLLTRSSCVVGTLVALSLEACVGSASAPDGAAPEVEAQIRRAIAQLDTLNNSHDDPAIRALYDPEAGSVYFYDGLPFQFKGAEGLARFGEQLFDQTTNYHQRTEVEAITASHNLAVAVCVIRSSWSDAQGKHSEIARDTLVFRNVSGRWRIWHEHASVPFDYETGRAVTDAQP